MRVKLNKEEIFTLQKVEFLKSFYGCVIAFETEVKIKAGVKSQEKALIIGKALLNNPRMKLTDMEKELKIPISTAYDILKRIQKEYDMKTVFIRRTK